MAPMPLMRMLTRRMPPLVLVVVVVVVVALVVVPAWHPSACAALGHVPTLLPMHMQLCVVAAVAVTMPTSPSMPPLPPLRIAQRALRQSPRRRSLRRPLPVSFRLAVWEV